MEQGISTADATTWFVSRHPGAIEWARRENIQALRWVSHIVAGDIAAGDTVIGTLPVHLAAAVCARGARYLHLVIDLPEALRGRELTPGQLCEFNARLKCYHLEERN